MTNSTIINSEPNPRQDTSTKKSRIQKVFGSWILVVGWTQAIASTKKSNRESKLHKYRCYSENIVNCNNIAVYIWKHILQITSNIIIIIKKEVKMSCEKRIAEIILWSERKQKHIKKKKEAKDERKEAFSYYLRIM